MRDANGVSGTRARIKLTYVIDVLDTNLAGTENQLIKMINGLDSGLFEIDLVCLRPHPWLEENGAMLRCTKRVIRVQDFGKPSAYVQIARLIRHFRAARPDVVHTFFPVSNIVAVLAARLAGVRGIVSSRRDYGEWMSPHYLLLTRFANRFVRRIVANSENVKRLTVARERADAEKVDVYLNGMDTGPYDDLGRDVALKQGLGIPSSSPVVGIVANFRAMKRHETFVHAAAEILRTRPDVHFLLVGGTPSTLPRKQRMEALAASLDIAPQLHFVGARQDVKPYLSIMDVGVNCSEREGLSNAVMEYMAARVPAVVSRSGGNTDLITDGVDGLTFELDDHCQLARHVLYLLNDPSLCKRLSGGARMKLEQQMSSGVMLKRYTTLYRQLARG